MSTINTQIEKRYWIKDTLVNEEDLYDTKTFTLSEIKELFKYGVTDSEDKEIIIDFNNEIDNSESIEDILSALKMYLDIDYYEFIEVKENMNDEKLEHWQHIQFDNGSNPYISKTKSNFEYMQNKYNLVKIKENFWLAKEK